MKNEIKIIQKKIEHDFKIMFGGVPDENEKEFVKQYPDSKTNNAGENNETQ
jgi:hypothetical protein